MATARGRIGNSRGQPQQQKAEPETHSAAMTTEQNLLCPSANLPLTAVCALLMCYVRV